jgi:hypothetical protein
MKILISYHTFLIEALLAVIILNLALHYFLQNNLIKAVKWVRIGYFSFWAFWAMSVFSGLIVFVFMKQPLTMPVILMIIAALILPVLDGYRAIKLKNIWLNSGDSGFKFSAKILILEILIIAVTTIVAIIK